MTDKVSKHYQGKPNAGHANLIPGQKRTRKGVPNKVNVDARRAIAAFVDGSAHKLLGWLDKVAEGQPEHKIPPAPDKAFTLYMSVVEYHIPKLNRTEVTHNVAKSVTEISDDALIMIATQQANVIEDAIIVEEKVRRE